MFCVATPKEIWQQMNYGTILEEVQPLYGTSEYWTHTFVLDTMPSIMPYQVPTCNCPQFSKLINRLQHMHDETIRSTKQTAETMLNMLSTPNRSHSRSRSRRSLLPFIGQISKGLFGLATSGDLRNVASHVNAIQAAIHNLNNKFNHQSENLASFMKTSNARMDNAFQAILDNHKIIQQMQSEWQKSVSDIEATNNWLFSILLEQMEYHQLVRSLYNNMFEGFITLLNGKLSPLIVSQDNLLHVIAKVSDAISSERPMFKLMHNSPAYYYKHADFMLHKSHTKVLITVRFPVTTHDQPLQLFKILSYPVPINSTSLHATKIMDLPMYLAVNEDFSTYATFTENAIQNCDHDKYHIHCQFAMPMQTQDQSSCALSLYQSDKSSIHKHCNFRFIPNAVQPTVRQLNQTHFLLINMSSVTLQCKNKQPEQIGCHYCIIQLPCNCTLLSTKYVIMPRFTNCFNTQVDVTISHPVNLILLQKFFGDTAIQSISPNSTFPKPLNVSLKPFVFFKHDFSKLATNDQKDHLNLDKMVTAAKEDKVIYDSMVDPILDSDILFDSTYSLEFVFSVVAIATSSITFVIVLIMCKRFKMLTTALTLSNQIKHSATAPATIPNFIYTDAPVTTHSPSIMNQIHEALPNYNTYILLALTFLTFLFFIKQLTNKFKRPYLVLEICNSTNSVSCFIQYLPTCITNCKFLAPAPPKISKVNISFSSTMHVKWADFKIIVDNNTEVLCPAQVIKLNLFKAYQFKKVINHPSKSYVTQLWIAHNNYCIPVDVRADNAAPISECTQLVTMNQR